jgi:hypothetical protein
MIPGSTDIVVDVSPVQSAYAAKVPDRQFRRGGAKGCLFPKDTQDNILHQPLGSGPGLGGDLRYLRFLLGSEMYFHGIQSTKKPLLVASSMMNPLRN